MFYLTTHSTHFIYGYMESVLFMILSIIILRKEGNILFNNTLNTIYLRLYGVSHMVKYHSTDSERNGLFFPINSKGSFTCTVQQTG